MFYVYVMQSKKDSRFYTGFTNDLRKRFREHSGNKVISTKNRGSFEMIYYEACINKLDASAREKYLKSGMGKRYLKGRLKRFLSLTGPNGKCQFYISLTVAVVTNKLGECHVCNRIFC